MTATVFPLDEGHDYFDATPAQISSRVSSLATAAQLVMTGAGLVDRRLAESIVIDLTETATWMARKLANYHDAIDGAARQPAP